jgi:hypothetical protein
MSLRPVQAVICLFRGGKKKEIIWSVHGLFNNPFSTVWFVGLMEVYNFKWRVEKEVEEADIACYLGGN